MITAAQPSFFEEHAWMLRDVEDWGSLSDSARRLCETRIAAMLFKRRWRLLIHWRRQSLARSREVHAGVAPPVARRRATTDGEITVLSNLPRRLPVLREEIAILRAFLAREINTILFDDAL
jgi:hypothetical protein